MDMVILDAYQADSLLANAKVLRVLVTEDSNLQVLYKASNRKLVQMAPDMVLLGENVDGELVFEDALEIHTDNGYDAKTREALRSYRAEHGKLVVLMSPLWNRDQLPVPQGAHRAFWAYTLQ
jgi:hypothetical protein